MFVAPILPALALPETLRVPVIASCGSLNLILLLAEIPFDPELSRTAFAAPGIV